MASIRTAPRATIAGLLLVLPLVILVLLFVLGLFPTPGLLAPLLVTPDPDQPDLGGSVVMLGALLGLLVSFAVSLLAVVRRVRAGAGIASSPLHLALAVVGFALITTAIVVFVVDQYPCWMGVLNCD